MNTKNIFEGAEFGDRFLTRDGETAVYISIRIEPLYDAAFLIIEGEKMVDEFYLDGKIKRGYSGNDIVSKKQESIDDISVYKWFRDKTCCGLTDAKNFINQLIEAIKNKPVFQTDSTLKLVYQEPMDKDIVDYCTKKQRDEDIDKAWNYVQGIIDYAMRGGDIFHITKENLIKAMEEK